MDMMKAGRMVDVGRMECEEIPVPPLHEASSDAAPPSCPALRRAETTERWA